ncbi:MAG TPA: MFS transporter [Candidatus Binataceae bacterium]|nr:MFS transporter [Candidatus Binataceae bacterium]
MNLAENKINPTAVSGIIRRYYSVWLTYSLAGGFLFGVYPIFLHARGLNQFQINSVLATYFVVLFLTDVPTGAFADALGRRRSFVLGAALRVFAFVLYFTAHHYWVFLIAESIDGIGTTFGNGAIDAWGVDALDDAGYMGLKDHLFSRVSQLTTIGFMVSSVIGAYVADIDIAWPWLCGAAGYVVSAAIGVWLMRGEKPRASGVDLIGLPRQIVRRIVEGVTSGFSSRTVLYLSLAGAIQFAAWAPYWLEWPLLFNQSYGVGVWIIGWIYCVLSIGRLLGAEVVSRLGGDETARGGRISALIACAGILLAAAGMFQARPTIALIFLFVMNICTGATVPMAQSWFNEQIESSQRATLLSFSSTFGTMGGSIGLIVNGYIADRQGLPMAWQFAGALTFVAIPCYLALRPRMASMALTEGAAK